MQTAQKKKGPLGILRAVSKGTAGIALAASIGIGFPNALPILGIAAAITPALLRRKKMPVPAAMVVALTPAGSIIRVPLISLAVARVLLPILSPSTWRGLRYWRRLTPILWGYYRTHKQSQRHVAQQELYLAEEVWKDQHRYASEAIFQMLVELKGFYLKLGQLLASKADLLPPLYTHSLSRLLDQMPPISYNKVARIVESDLGFSIEELFESFDEEPIASATIAQVHRASLYDGAGSVAVKVQHPGVRKMMLSDLANVRMLSELLLTLGIDVGFDQVTVIDQYQECVPGEFDFEREAWAMNRAAATLLSCMGPEGGVRVPAPYLDLTSERVLTMEFLEGAPFLDSVRQLPKEERTLIMRNLIEAFGAMILSDGLFHTDPHPGNLLLLRDRKTVGLLDWGQIKEISVETQLLFARLTLALAARDHDTISFYLSEAGLVLRNCSDAFFEKSGYILFDTRMDFAEAFLSPMDPNGREFRSTKVDQMPPELFMVIRVVFILRGVLASLDVDLSASQIWVPYAIQALEREGCDADLYMHMNSLLVERDELTVSWKPLSFYHEEPLPSALKATPVRPTYNAVNGAVESPPVFEIEEKAQTEPRMAMAYVTEAKAKAPHLNGDAHHRHDVPSTSPSKLMTPEGPWGSILAKTTASPHRITYVVQDESSPRAPEGDPLSRLQALAQASPVHSPRIASPSASMHAPVEVLVSPSSSRAGSVPPASSRPGSPGPPPFPRASPILVAVSSPSVSNRFKGAEPIVPSLPTSPAKPVESQAPPPRAAESEAPRTPARDAEPLSVPSVQATNLEEPAPAIEPNFESEDDQGRFREPSIELPKAPPPPPVPTPKVAALIDDFADSPARNSSPSGLPVLREDSELGERDDETDSSTRPSANEFSREGRAAGSGTMGRRSMALERDPEDSADYYAATHGYQVRGKVTSSRPKLEKKASFMMNKMEKLNAGLLGQGALSNGFGQRRSMDLAAALGLDSTATDGALQEIKAEKPTPEEIISVQRSAISFGAIAQLTPPAPEALDPPSQPPAPLVPITSRGAQGLHRLSPTPTPQEALQLLQEFTGAASSRAPSNSMLPQAKALSPVLAPSPAQSPAMGLVLSPAVTMAPAAQANGVSEISPIEPGSMTNTIPANRFGDQITPAGAPASTSGVPPSRFVAQQQPNGVAQNGMHLGPPSLPSSGVPSLANHRHHLNLHLNIPSFSSSPNGSSMSSPARPSLVQNPALLAIIPHAPDSPPQDREERLSKLVRIHKMSQHQFRAKSEEEKKMLVREARRGMPRDGKSFTPQWNSLVSSAASTPGWGTPSDGSGFSSPNLMLQTLVPPAMPPVSPTPPVLSPPFVPSPAPLAPPAIALPTPAITSSVPAGPNQITFSPAPTAAPMPAGETKDPVAALLADPSKLQGLRNDPSVLAALQQELIRLKSMKR